MAAYSALTEAQQRALRLQIIRILKVTGTANEDDAKSHDQIHAAISSSEA